MNSKLDILEIKTELSKVKESSDQVRKGIFARYNEFTKSLDYKYQALQQEVSELKCLVEQIHNKTHKKEITYVNTS